MKVILAGRGAGKTTKLIKQASKGRYKLIVCRHHNEAARIFELAKKMKEDKIIKSMIPMPISYDEFLKGEYAQGRNIEEFLIDDAQVLLQGLTHIPIGTITINKDDK